MNPDNEGWFNQFSLLFEVVSAYATIGLSLGIPTENYSFSGALRPGSKIILILVMLRGRHRDLPVAIDRASKPPSSLCLGKMLKVTVTVLLPSEFEKTSHDSKRRHVLNDETARALEEDAVSPSEAPLSEDPLRPDQEQVATVSNA
jgi:hypothetical protein